MTFAKFNISPNSPVVGNILTFPGMQQPLITSQVEAQLILAGLGHELDVVKVCRSFDLHFVIKDPRFAGGGARNEVPVEDIQNIRTNFAELFFNLCAVLFDHIQLFFRAFILFFLLD